MSKLHFAVDYGGTAPTGAALPVEVRRSNMTLAARGMTSQPIELPAGAYHVLLRLPNGEELQAEVELGDADATAVLRADRPSPREFLATRHFFVKEQAATLDDESGLESFGGAEPTLRVVRGDGRTRIEIDGGRAFELEALGRVDPANNEAALALDVMEVGAALELRLLEPAAQARVVLTEATGPRGRRAQHMFMLPSTPTESAFRVLLTAREETEGPPFDVDVHLQDGEVEALLRFLDAADPDSARAVSSAVRAEERLFGKANDPIGATIGAYALLQLGELDRLHEWTENLRAMFRWLPDGAVIRGEHLARRMKHEAAAACFVEAVERGVPTLRAGVLFALDRLALYARITKGLPPELIEACKRALARLRARVDALDLAEPFTTTHTTETEGEHMRSIQDRIRDTETRYKNVVPVLEEELEPFGPVATETLDSLQARLRRAGFGATADGIKTKADLAYGALMPKLDLRELNVLERIIGRNDLVDFDFLERAMRAGRAVGRVVLKNAAGTVLGHATAFVISPELVLTNHHVFGVPEDARDAILEMNFQRGVDGRMLASTRIRLDPARFFVAHEPLDYAAVAVHADDVAALAPFGTVTIAASDMELRVGERLNVIQHPNGEPKQIAMRENLAVRFVDAFVRYESDTAPGSSGAPVFNELWEVVAIHHSGVPRRDAAGNILARDGSIWTEAMGEHRIDWEANEGIRIGRVLDHLRDRGASMPRGDLLSRIVVAAPPIEIGVANPKPLVVGVVADATPPMVQQSMLVQRTATSGGAPPPPPPSKRPKKIAHRPAAHRPAAPPPVAPPHVAAAPSSGPSFAFTVPLHVTVSVGAPSPGAPPPAPPAPPARPDQRAPASSAEAREKERALAELERAETRAYFDAEADAQSRAAYYADLTIGEDPEANREALAELLASTHEKELPYKPSVELYPWVDLRPSRKLHSCYSDAEMDPESVIEADFTAEAKRARGMEALRAQESTLAPEAFAEQVALLEASASFNCEHVVPQSWFSKRQPMRGDLHHLFACEPDCNSFRGNTPYFDFGAEEAARELCGRREPGKFEPAAGKGAVARAVLYFLVRYPGEINASSKEYEASRIDVLLDWHRSFPVDAYEQHRNQAIFEKQGNRNPFIDFPEWAERVDFIGALGA